MRIQTTFQHDMVAVQTEQELHLLIELTAPPAPDTAGTRQPLHLALALDRSGSMAGVKLDAARAAASFLVDQLHDDDRLALVTYDDSVQLVAPLDKLDRPALGHAIAGIRSGGMTNLSGGWLKAAEELNRDTVPNDPTRAVEPGVRRVLLLSDGHANQGITDHHQLAGVATSLAANGVTTTTIGFGDGFDEELLTAMADAGRGDAHYAASVEDLPGIFADEFDDLVSLAAQNVSVELRPGTDVELIQVLNSHPTVSVPGGVQILVGDTFADQAVRLVVKLSVPAVASLGLATIGEVVLKWVAVGDAVEAHTVTVPLVVNAVSADDAANATENPQVIEEVTVLLAGERAAEARRLADEGRYDEAARLARKTARELRNLDPEHPAALVLAESAASLDMTADSIDANRYDRASSKELHYRARRMQKRKRDDR